jgi:hypothetical protein
MVAMIHILRSMVSLVAGISQIWFQNLQDGFLGGGLGVLLTLALLCSCSTLPYEEEIGNPGNWLLQLL